MIFKTNHKIPLLIFFIVLLSYTTVVAQLDSIKVLNKKIAEFSHSSNFSGKDTTYINLLNNLSYRLRYTALDSMELLATKALELSKAANYKKGELEALINFSAVNLYKGETAKTIEYGQNVLDTKEIATFPKLQIRIYNQLGQAYFIKQDYPSTYSQFTRALAIGEKYDDEDNRFKLNMNLGTMFSLLEDYDEAIPYYTASHEAALNLNNDVSEAMVSANIGYMYVQTGDFEKAEVLLLNSIKIFKTKEIKEWLAFSYNTYGLLNLKTSDFQEALVDFQNALKIHGSLNDIKGRADIHFGLAKAYLGLENLSASEEHINESLNLFKSFNLKTGLEKCYRVLYEIKKKQGLLAESLHYLELTEQLANDISKEKNKRNLNMLNAKLNFEKEKENLKIKNDLEIDQQRKYLSWSLAALLTLFIVALIIFRLNARKKILNKKLENQTLVLKENQKTLENINSNQDRLFSIVGHDLRGPIISLKELIILYLEDKEGKEYFEKFAPQLRDDLEQLQFTMDNLLHWGKTQMKGYSINIERIAVKKELESILLLLRKEIEKKSIVIANLTNAENYVYADLDQFKVIFRNLISNAIKFTPEQGKITISTEMKNDQLVIKISDTGVGMPKEVVNNLFKNTEYFSTYGTNFEKGTGLGLRLVKEMAVINKGNIYAKSQPNVGSDFYVDLPTSLS